ncbi:hypothetical protein V496_03044 [Pseudogymnoascus sp. VKM F-4515 (FW-2607)]|nr:hypothetical protein V496_03044 [Pseudogymnoascus sp. VKM F-4515 (FW-2607)]
MWRRSRTALGELTENRIIAAARSARRAQVRGICAAGGCGGCAEARQVSGATGRQGIGGGVWLLVGGPRESGDGRGGCTSGFLQHRYTISCLANLLLASAIKAGQDKIELVRCRPTCPSIHTVLLQCHVMGSLVDVKPPIVPWPSPKSTAPGPSVSGSSQYCTIKERR